MKSQSSSVMSTTRAGRDEPATLNIASMPPSSRTHLSTRPATSSFDGDVGPDADGPVVVLLAQGVEPFDVDVTSDDTAPLGDETASDGQADA